MKPSSMLSAVNAYLVERRRLGYALMIEGEELLRFAKYADESGHNGPITTELAIRWAKLPVHANPLYWARRLDMVRRLAKHQIMSEPGTEIPPNGILGPSYRRPTPYIYTSDEISALLTEAARLGPPNGIRPHTYRTLFGLLVCTGLRISEALRLTRLDVDLQARLLRITQSKFRKERWVPIHISTAGALSAYAHRRDRHLPLATES